MLRPACSSLVPLARSLSSPVAHRLAAVLCATAAIVLSAWPARHALAAASAQDAPSSPAPRMLGFEEGAIGSRGDAFFVATPGWKSELVEDRPAAGARVARLSRVVEPGAEAGGAGNLMGFVDATPYRGKRVALTSKVRLGGGERDGGAAQMWFRVDCANQRMGAFDNMQDRPIRARQWTHATIEQDVAGDAIGIAVGWLAVGGATVVDIDDVELRVVGDAAAEQPASAPRALSARELENVAAAARLLSLVRFFHPSDQVLEVEHWDLAAIDLIEQAEPATSAEDLARRLSAAVAPLAPTIQIWAGSPEQAPREAPLPAEATRLRSWRHQGAGRIGAMAGGGIYRSSIVDEPAATPIDVASREAAFAVRSLGGGVSCRVPLKVPADDEGTLPRGEIPPRFGLGAPAQRLTLANRSTRLVAVALAWGVFEHFYPYFDVIGIDWERDWNAALERSLTKAAMDGDDVAALKTLRELVAVLRDGHGGVYLPGAGATSTLPLALRWCGDDLVVTGRGESAPQEIGVGDVVLSIDGRTSGQILAELSKTISAATEGWRRYIAATQVVTDVPTGDRATIRFRRPDGSEHEAQVARVAGRAPAAIAEHRPANGSELAPGIAYFNLSGTDNAALEKAMPAILAAKGIVLDLRGYPSDAAYRMLEHLISEPAQSARWNVPIVTQPNRQGWTWLESGRWDMRPRVPHIGVPVAFLTDGRAISYAESIMGIVEAYRLGDIVGETTAGTNGNVNPFTLPGGASVAWTGMKVLKHDGSRHHGVGIAPTVPMVPTPKGIAAGRDEVLERAVQVVQQRIEAGGVGH